MRITVNPVLDMETLCWVSDGGQYDYSGPVLSCKGDSVAKQSEEQQSQFDQQLMQIFQQQYATQQGQLKFLQGQLMPQIKAGGIGYTPTQLASLRTNATDTNAQQFADAKIALQNNETQASGGSKLVGVSGANVEAGAGLLSAEAQQQASSQQQITQANANLQQENYWRSIGALSGNAEMENPLGYASGATQGSGAVAGLSNAYTNSNQSQLLGALGGIVGGVGGALGGYLGRPNQVPGTGTGPGVGGM